MSPWSGRYELRSCTEFDREWAYALKSEAYREVVERQFGPWNEAFQRELFSKRWHPEKSNLILVDGTAVGLVAAEERAAEWWLDEIQLLRGWQGRGIGTAIVCDFLQRARCAGKPLRLQVLKENQRAHALYLGLGFKDVQETNTHRLMEWG
jgi:GNAT superfamily N-acetyltransferase